MSVQKRGNSGYRGGGRSAHQRGGGNRQGGGYNNRGNPHFRTNIEFGARGFFFTVDGTNQERAAVREVYNLYDMVKEVVADEPEAGDQKKVIMDAADELEAACQESTSEQNDESGRSKTVHLRQVPTNVRNCLFFQTEMSPDEIYSSASRMVDKCQEKPLCRFVARCIPVEDCAGTELSNLAAALEKVVHRHFVQSWKDENPPSYALEFKARNNDQLNRQDVLSILDEQIKRLAPLSRVNLTGPDITILVNVLHKNVLLSGVRGYFEKRKYSTRPPAEKNDSAKPDLKAESSGEAGLVSE